jgi:hypothetical protein
MAELKSTLELVMERTRNMVESPEERARKQAEERTARAKGILLRLREEQIRPEELPRVLEDAADQAPEELEAAVLSALVDEIGFSGQDGVLLDGFKVLVGPVSLEVVGRVKDLTSTFQEARSRLTDEAAAKAGAELSARGISGSAVRPKFEATQSYRTGLEDLTKDFEGRLNRLQEEMRRLK